MPLTKINNDPIGAAIKDYYSGNEEGKILVKSDVAGEEYFMVKYFFRTINQMPALERMALEACRGKILDIGAGAGCHSIILQNRKYEVTALEKSEEASKVMTRMGIKKVVCKDLFEYNGEKFDTLLLLMNGIGFSGRLEGFINFLEYAKNLLKSKGQIIFDSSDIKNVYILNNKEDLMKEKTYYGEITYTLKYKNAYVNDFSWLFIDYDTAKKYAIKAGYLFSLLGRDNDNGYLARLILSS